MMPSSSFVILGVHLLVGFPCSATSSLTSLHYSWLLPLSYIFDTLAYSVDSTFDTSPNRSEGIADWLADRTCRVVDGATEPASDSTGDTSDRADQAADEIAGDASDALCCLGNSGIVVNRHFEIRLKWFAACALVARQTAGEYLFFFFGK